MTSTFSTFSWLTKRRLIFARVKTEAGFSAEDPWNQNRRTPFTLEAYLMVPRGATPAPGAKALAGYFYGVRSELDGVEHMLPESLVELWRTSRIPLGALPALLKQMEPRLKEADYRNILGNKALKVFQYIFAGMMAVLVAAIAGLMFSGDAGLPMPAATALVAVVAAFAWGAMYLIFVRPKRRRMRQMDWVLAHR